MVAAIVADCVRTWREQGRQPLEVTVDVEPQHERAIAAEPPLVRRALEPLIRRAFESATELDASRASQPLREIVVTSIDLGDAIEVEVADCGPSLADPVRRWLNQSAHDQAARGSSAVGTAPEGTGLALIAIRAAASRLAGTLHAAHCPEGGVALTLRLPRRQARRMAA